MIKITQKTFLCAFLFCVIGTCTLGEDFTTLNGKTYSGKICRVEPDGISIKHSAGITKLLFSELPKEYIIKYGSSPEWAAEYKSVRDAAAAQSWADALARDRQALRVQQAREQREKIARESPDLYYPNGEPRISKGTAEPSQPSGPRRCLMCSGRGRSSLPCPTCSGRGLGIGTVDLKGISVSGVLRTCPQCSGSGHPICTTCGGTGWHK